MLTSLLRHLMLCVQIPEPGVLHLCFPVKLLWSKLSASLLLVFPFTDEDAIANHHSEFSGSTLCATLHKAEKLFQFQDGKWKSSLESLGPPELTSCCQCSWDPYLTEDLTSNSMQLYKITEWCSLGELTGIYFLRDHELQG